MLTTRKSRAIVKNTLLTVVTLMVFAIAPYITYGLKAYTPYKYGNDYGYGAPAWLQLVGSIMWVVDAGIILYILYHLLFETLPAWVKKGEVENPMMADKQVLNTLRADNKRLMTENLKLGKENKELAAMVAGFQDPPKPEPEEPSWPQLPQQEVRSAA